MNPFLGQIVMFTGDKRKLQAVLDGVTTFSATAHALKQGEDTVTSTYISDSSSSVGNVFITGTLGSQASMPAGNYRYFITGTHSGKITTFYWDILVFAKDLSQLDGLPDTDYTPLVDVITMYEGDMKSLSLTVSAMEMTSATGLFKDADTDVTSTYCSSSVSVSDSTVTTHVIGGQASIPAAQYGYFVSITHANGDAIATYYWKIIVLPKQSVI